MKAREYELTEHDYTCLAVRSALSALRLSRCQDADVLLAAGRLEEWLCENDERWGK